MGALTTSEIASKWRKHVILAREPAIHKYLPETAVLTKSELLWEYLSNFSFIILKPVVGTGGRGIIKIGKIGDNKVLLQTGLKKQVFYSKSELVVHVTRLTKGQSYLIQQGINLITINERPIDFRILLYKRKNQWEFMGGMGKLAAKNKIITNFCKGGKPITVEKALKYGLKLNAEECSELEQKLQALGTVVASTFDKQYKSIRELGLDVAIDKNLHIWILEVNTRPMYNLFRYHADRTLYNKIDKYVKVIHLQKRKLRKS
jgi:hypothetical protein